jgi:hypothetical protein
MPHTITPHPLPNFDGVVVAGYDIAIIKQLEAIPLVITTNFIRFAFKECTNGYS